jgi:hypothetical protein
LSVHLKHDPCHRHILLTLSPRTLQAVIVVPGFIVRRSAYWS